MTGDEGFVGQVKQALAAIPHQCSDKFGSCGRSNHNAFCEADHDERIAQRVAVAVESVWFEGWEGRQRPREAFLRALGRESREEPRVG